jgi:hypothetical protein
MVIKTEIIYQRLVIGNLLDDFMPLLDYWRSNLRQFKLKLSRLRDKSFESELVDSVYDNIISYVEKKENLDKKPIKRNLEILKTVVKTIDFYANDPFAQCSQKNLKQHWVESLEDIDNNYFFSKLTNSVFCTVPKLSPKTVTSYFATYTILLIGVVIWLLVNKNSQTGISFSKYFGDIDPEIAPAVISGAISPPKAIIEEIQDIEYKADQAYIKTIKNKRSSPSSQKINDATEASIFILKQESKRASPVAKLIITSDIIEKEKDIVDKNLKHIHFGTTKRTKRRSKNKCTNKI